MVAQVSYVIYNSKMQTGTAWNNILHKYSAKHTEPHHPQQNPSRMQSQDHQKLHQNKIMDCTGAPSKTWFLCLLYVVFLLNHTAEEALAWRIPIKSCFGHTPDLSPLLQFTFYKPVCYLDHKACFPRQGSTLDSLWGLQRTKEMHSPTGYSTMTFNSLPDLWYILQLSRNSTNAHLNPPDPATLDLMSDLVGGSLDFDPIPHLGYSFVHADTNGIPHMTMVIDVDEETGHILLEYLHGQVKWVEPNILQEALLSHADDDDSSNLWTFSMVLNHKTENNKVQVQVQIKWDNGNITWKPLNSL